MTTGIYCPETLLVIARSVSDEAIQLFDYLAS
jgi:hypothetical protein